jgi:hypothetical protein
LPTGQPTLNPLLRFEARKHFTWPIAALAAIWLAALTASGIAQSGDPVARKSELPMADRAAGKTVPETTLRPSVPPEWQLEAPFQSGIHCGPNSLYLLLRLSGVEVSLEQVERSVPLSSTGCTLDDLRRAAIDLGLAVEVRKVNPDEFKELPKPLIAHFLAPASGLGAPAQVRDHFAVVTRTLPDGGFQSIDSNNLVTATYLGLNFARNFSGYCLVVKPSLISRMAASRAAWLAGVLLALMATNAILGRYLRGR